MDIRLKRAYEPAVPADGDRLIDRLWPRDGWRHEAKLDDWDKELSQRRRGPRGGSPTQPAEGSKVTSRASRPHVLIAGGGVAGLETLLALHALAADRLDVTILAPELKFVNLSLSVEQPFQRRRGRGRGLRLEDTAAELGARWHRGALDRVEHDQHRVVTKDGDALTYDRLVLALGAHPEREWQSDEVLTYHGGRDGPSYRLLIHQLHEGRVDTVAFIKPAGASWPLPLYDLALMTAADCAAHNRAEVELSLVTPEEEPLGIFGSRASAAVRRLLYQSGVTLLTSSYGVPNPPGRLDVSPGDRSLAVDRVVTEPRLVGPSLRGIPSGRDGFIHTDAHGRVPGLDDVFAAGDATTFPVKQGGLAAQQADAVAETIAASAGADIDPQPFRPILRGVLLTGGPRRFLRADISGAAGDDSIVSDEALWWPPNKLCGRYLAPYLSSQVGEAADVVAQDKYALPVETALDPVAPDAGTTLGELSDSPPRRGQAHRRVSAGSADASASPSASAPLRRPRSERSVPPGDGLHR